jgi:hypothetical protein
MRQSLGRPKMAKTITVEITHTLTIEKAAGDFYLTGKDGKQKAVHSVAGLMKAVMAELEIVPNKRGPRTKKADAPAEAPKAEAPKGKK